MRHGDAGARLARQLSEFQASPGAQSPPAVADFSELSVALYCDPYWLVHRRSRPSALGGLWSFANRGRNDAVLDDTRRHDLARDLLCGLRLHIRIRHILHLSAHPHRSRWQAVRDSASRSAEPTDVTGRCSSDSPTEPRRRWRIT